ncbi:MAG: AmmeMemoRadiSam system protein A [Candidatus Diapherotrites archaeon]|nr:AmmeMemoRadiSam system protein A [Candidatus Diapherotrites archaeon]
MLTLEQGKFLVKTARKAVEYFLPTSSYLQEITSDKELNKFSSVFVTIKNYPGHSLRGCIGFPEATDPLLVGTIYCAVNAAFKDARFKPVKADDLNKITLTVSIVSGIPKEISGSEEEILPQIDPKKCGIIVEKNTHKGFLFPSAAKENNWTAQQFLEEACKSARLLPSAWKEARTTIKTFEVQEFKEEEPRNKIVQL